MDNKDSNKNKEKSIEDNGEEEIIKQKSKKKSGNIFNLQNIEIFSEKDKEFKRRLSSGDLETLSPTSKANQKKSYEFYKRFVNGIKKSKLKEENGKNDSNTNESNKLLKIVNKMMDEMVIKNNNKMRYSIKERTNKKDILVNRRLTYNKNDGILKSIILIQRQFREYKYKKKLFSKLINEKQKYLSIKEIKNKEKNDLEVELIKNINRDKLLFDALKYLNNKIKIIENENKKLKKKYIKDKNDLNIMKQENFYIIDNELISILKNDSNENKKILKRDKNKVNTNNKVRKRVTICDMNEQTDIIKKVNNISNENNQELPKISNNQNDNMKNNENNNNNENIIDNESQKIVETQIEKNARLKKSRGLRKLLTKRGREKKDILRKYFKKFYLGGLYLSIRRCLKNKTYLTKKSSRRNKSVDLDQKRLMTFDRSQFNLNDDDDEEEENDEDFNVEKIKRKKLLLKIIYRKDRVINLILKKSLQKLNLRAKLISLQEAQKERLARSKTKTKLKKKNKHKARSVSAFNEEKMNKTIISKKNNYNNLGLINNH